MLLLFVGFMRVLALDLGIVNNIRGYVQIKWNLEYLCDGVHNLNF